MISLFKRGLPPGTVKVSEANRYMYIHQDFTIYMYIDSSCGMGYFENSFRFIFLLNRQGLGNLCFDHVIV